MEGKELPRFYIILAGGRGDPVRDVSTVSESPEIETGGCHVPWAQFIQIEPVTISPLPLHSCYRMISNTSPHLSPDPTGGITFQAQDRLPKLPIPDLKETTDKYLAALTAIQVT